MSVIVRKIYCPDNKKRCFPTAIDAKLSLIKIKDDNKRESYPIRVYYHEPCGSYHTTSRPERKNEARKANGSS